MPSFRNRLTEFDATRDEVIDAMLHADRAQHDELGRTRQVDPIGDPPSRCGPREQAAGPLDLHNVDE